MTEWLMLLQDTWPAASLRASRWAYPVVNTGHILGIALLFGAIVPLDFRLLGVWPNVPIDTVKRVLIPVAAIGLALAVLTGAMLFSVHAVRYAGHPLFQVKLAVIAAALANLAFLRGAVAGTVSLLLWPGVILCGRMIAYT